MSGHTASADAKLVGDAVSTKLKAFYAEISSEKVPDRFLDLLSQLDAASTENRTKK